MFKTRLECPICSGTNFVSWGPPLYAKDFLPLWGMYDPGKLKRYVGEIEEILPNGFGLAKCHDCTGVFSSQVLEDAAARQIYDQVLGEDLSQQRSQQLDKKRLVLQVTNVLLELVTNFRDDCDQLTMLDYGCGWGDFIRLMAFQGVDVRGVEFSRKKMAFAAAQGLEVTSDLSSIEPKQIFDLILSWQVLEHLEDPFSVLSDLRSIAHDKAILLLGVPNFSVKRLEREFAQAPELRSRNLNPIEHLTYFDGHTLTLLAERAGWQRIYTKRPLLEAHEFSSNGDNKKSIVNEVRGGLAPIVRKRDRQTKNLALGTYAAFRPKL